MLRKFIFVTFLILIFSSPSQAKLAPSSLNTLIQESDLIVFADLLLVDYQSLQKNRAGKAKLQVKETIYNKAKSIPEKTLWISWSSEEHDQSIDQPGEWLLFLKRNSTGEWTGTHYGRSYLRIYTHSEWQECKKYAIYDYPLALVSLSKELIKNVSQQTDKELLCMDRLIPYIQKQIKSFKG